MQPSSVGMNFTEEEYWAASAEGGMGRFPSNSSLCAMDEVQQVVAAQCAYWLEGVLLTIVGVLGILGNIISIVVLTSRDMQNSFNLLLSCLATIDIVFIIIAVLDYSLAREFCWPFDMESEIYAILFPKFLFPINNIIFNASIFLTIVIAYERYCAVCRPHAYRDSTLGASIGRRVAGYVVPVIIFSALLNIPRFLETELVMTEVMDEETGEWRNETTYIRTELRMNPHYIFYYVNGSRLILTQILPVASLVYFNTAIFRGIKYAHVRSNRNSSSHNEVNLATVLICIVIMFLLCHFPRLIINVAEFIINRTFSECGDHYMPPAWFLCLTSFMHWLLIVNSSSNFIIYCFMGQQFKQVLRKKITSVAQCWGGPARSPKRSNGTKSQDKATVREDNGSGGVSVKLVTQQGAL